MKSRFLRWLWIASAAVVLIPAIVHFPAQAEEGRKIRSRVSPIYPELARRVNATGTVRLEIQVSPSGDVKNVKVLGGHPLLVGAAEDAIRRWKYEASSDMTTTIVEFKFSPSM